MVRPKVVVTRNLGPNVMPLLHKREDLDVRSQHHPYCQADFIEKVVIWPEDRIVDRNWLLQNISGAAGVLLMLTEKVTKSRTLVTLC